MTRQGTKTRFKGLPQWHLLFFKIEVAPNGL